MSATFNFVDLISLSPYFIVLIGALLLLLVETFSSATSKKMAAAIVIVVLLLAIFAASTAPRGRSLILTHWLRFDHLARLFNLFFLAIGLTTTLLSISFFKRFQASQAEYFFLLLSAIFGLMLIGTAADFLTLFIGLETLSVSLYILCGYMKKWEISDESAMKYFLIGSLATAFLVYGIALIYGAVGTLSFSELATKYQALTLSTHKVLFLSGIALVTLGLCFKAAIVPFHVWAPDVYEGASTPVTSFMAVGTKVGAFAAFTRVFFDALPLFDPLWNLGLSLLVYPTLIYANLVAIRQTQLRRFFAYSGISHAGFLLIPIAVSSPDALQALVFYLIVYSVATLGAFAILSTLDKTPHGPNLHDLKGLFHTSPVLASIFAFCLLTLAGIPPTPGFFAKFYIFKVAYQAHYTALVVVALIATLFAAYYYLRLIGFMLEKPQTQASAAPFTPSLIVASTCIVTLAYLTFFPTPLLQNNQWQNVWSEVALKEKVPTTRFSEQPL